MKQFIFDLVHIEIRLFKIDLSFNSRNTFLCFLKLGVKIAFQHRLLWDQFSLINPGIRECYFIYRVKWHERITYIFGFDWASIVLFRRFWTMGVLDWSHTFFDLVFLLRRFIVCFIFVLLICCSFLRFLSLPFLFLFSYRTFWAFDR